MLIFDCTQAASDFFSSKVKGKIVTHVQPAASAEQLQSERPESADAQRWQLHATKFGKFNILLAMKTDTRYAMLFVGLKRNDVKGFLQQFLSRYIGEVVMTALQLKLPIPSHPELQERITDWENSLMDAHFFKRGDRGVQAHMNDALGMAAYDAYEGRGLPEELNDLIAFDQRLNRTLRSIKGGGYFQPSEREIQQAYPRLGRTLAAEQVTKAYDAWNSFQSSRSAFDATQ
jgi:Txe/YoeB family toxin of Txe-Axe toxin-antitoxin module